MLSGSKRLDVGSLIGSLNQDKLPFSSCVICTFLLYFNSVLICVSVCEFNWVWSCLELVKRSAFQCSQFNKMRGEAFEADLRLLKLGGCDIVLGVD